MRSMILLLLGASVAACTTAPPQPRSAQAEAHLHKLLAGKSAGQPVTCLPSYRSRDMITIDDNTLVFRDSGSRVYVNNLEGGGCANLGRGFYTLVTRTTGSGLCRGEIAEVADLNSGMTVGSCVLGDFVPYTRTGA